MNKMNRIISAMNETERMLEKAKKKYNDTIICLKMEIAENKELGNPITANKGWIDYANQDKARVKELERHMEKLNGMLLELK